MFKIGNIEITGKLVFAPVAGFSDSPYRRLAREFGSAFAVTELISADGIVRNNQKTLDLMKFHKSERPVAIQIFGRDVEVMTEASIIVEKLGVDFIDINMGCPASRVVKNGDGAGSALLLNPELINKMVSSIVKYVSIPVTAKIRLGWDNEHQNYFEVVHSLEDAGISLIAVHGRTKSQAYSGVANWDAIGEIKSMAAVPIIGNGDISSYDDALEKIEKYKCDAVMIGRAAFGNPWIFSGRKPNLQEIVELMKHHLDMMIEHYGERGIILMRKHLVKYIHGFRNSKVLRSKLVRSESKDEIFSLLDDFLTGENL